MKHCGISSLLTASLWGVKHPPADCFDLHKSAHLEHEKPYIRSFGQFVQSAVHIWRIWVMPNSPMKTGDDFTGMLSLALRAWQVMVACSCQPPLKSPLSQVNNICKRFLSEISILHVIKGQFASTVHVWLLVKFTKWILPNNPLLAPFMVMASSNTSCTTCHCCVAHLPMASKQQWVKQPPFRMEKSSPCFLVLGFIRSWSGGHL